MGVQFEPWMSTLGSADINELLWELSKFNDFPGSALGSNQSWVLFCCKSHLEHQENFKVFHKNNDTVSDSLVKL